jgi:hypothetical protein
VRKNDRVFGHLCFTIPDVGRARPFARDHAWPDGILSGADSREKRALWRFRYASQYLTPAAHRRLLAGADLDRESAAGGEWCIFVAER